VDGGCGSKVVWLIVAKLATAPDGPRYRLHQLRRRRRTLPSCGEQRRPGAH